MSYVLTKEDIARFRKADRLAVVYNPKGDPNYRDSAVRLIRQDEQEYTLDGCPVRVRGGSYNLITPEIESRLVGFGFVYFYHDQVTPSSSAVRQLRAGDEIEFEFHPDRHTNGYLAAAGLHADVLLLSVYRGGKKRFTFEIGKTTTPNDSTARMVRGLVESDAYRHDAYDCRKTCWKPPAAVVM